MSVTTFDTLKFVEKLKAAGLDERHARVMVEAQKDALSEALETHLATKSDISNLELNLERQLHPMRTDLTVLRWMLGALIAANVTILLKLFM